MLQVSGLSKSYGAQVLFQDATFSVNRRERVGLVGRNGHGKSTLFKILLDEEDYDSGTISVPKDYNVGHLSQNISFSESTVLAEGCTGLPKNNDGWEETHKVEAVLHGLGFSEKDFHQDPNLLSGGFQVRLNLGKLLVSGVDLLLLDEPTNYLDIVSLRWLAQFLTRWPGEIILITHNQSFMDSVTTHTMGIHRQQVRKISGPTEKLYELLDEEEEHYQKTRENQLKQREQTEDFIRRFRSKASKARQVQSRVKLLEKQGSLEALENIKSLDFSFRSVDFPGKRILGLKSGSFRYSSQSEFLFQNLNFEAVKGERIGIIGKNGKGKTTLLRLIADELKLTEGEFFTSPHARVGYFGQTNIERLDPSKTVEDEVLSVHPEHNRTAARSICGMMMFEGDLALKKIEVLSGGEKSRVLLGKLLVSPTNLLLLDEPTNHLDLYSSETFREAVTAYPGTVMLVTHDETLLHEVATRLIIFDRGETTFFNGTYQEFLDKIGWASEDEDRKKKQSSGLSKKELRQQRAQLQQKRTEILKPLEKKMKKLEKEIEELENKIEEQNTELLEGTIEGYCDEMAKLSRTIHQNKGKRDELYEELELVMSDHEQKEEEINREQG